MRCVAYLAGLAACLALSSPERAFAQSNDYTQLTSPQSAQNWYLTVGAGLRYQPDYTGSDDYIFRARPIISLGRGLKSTWWSAEDDAMLSIGVFSGQGWRIGFSGDLLWKRSAKVNPALVAVPATKFGGEAGGFVEFYPTSWKAFFNASVKQFFGTNDGFTGRQISEWLGDTTVAYQTSRLSTNSSTSTGPVFSRDGNQGSSVDQSVSFERRSLLTPDETVRLLSGSLPDQTRHGLTFISGVNPIRNRLVPWFLGQELPRRAGSRSPTPAKG